MSRIGRSPIELPAGVSVSISPGRVMVNGPLGELARDIPQRMDVKQDDGTLTVTRPTDRGEDRALHGLTRSLIANMIEGVTKGYEKNLEVVGVGWTASLAGKNLKLIVGYANPILVAIPEGVKVAVEKQIIKISGADKQAVGELAAEVRSKRKPEPYNGKGIKYTDEVIKRKQGKQFGA